MRTIYLSLPSTALALFTLFAGCDKSAQPVSSGSGSAGQSPVAQTPAAQPAAALEPPTGELLRETWDAVRLDGAHIGHVRTRYYRESDAGRPIQKIVVDNKLALARAGNRVEQQSRETTWRLPDGSVTRFEITAMFGQSRQGTTGIVTGDKATLVLSTGGKDVTQTIDWPAGTRSSLGVEDELRAALLQPGETRRFPMFLPMFNSVVDVELKHAGVGPVEVDGSPRNLTRVDARATPKGQNGQHLDSTYWTDEAGETLKLEMAALRLSAVRTTADRALPPTDQILPDIMTDAFVRPEPPLRLDAHAKKFARYQVRLADAHAAESFPTGSYQVVEPAADGSATVTVLAIQPDSPMPPGAKHISVVEADRRPNPFIESDDPAIVQAAKEHGGADADPWIIALHLESFVQTYLESVNFSQLFATAGEAYRSKKGDCSEHAMLLCALLRARGIPARTAVGLVYVPTANAFGYHMWTEAYIADRWIPLDAAGGRGGITAAYLKVSDSNFDGVDPLTTLLPVTRLLGKLKIEVLETR